MKTTQELLNQLTKANKEYKLKLAVKAGFSSVEEYRNSLFKIIQAPVHTFIRKGLKKDKPLKVNKVTNKDLARIFLQNFGKKATISFQKKIDVSLVYKQLLNIYQYSNPVEYASNLDNELKTILEGEERLMNYIFHGKFDNNGLAYVTDLDQPESDNLRVINLDRINWIELDNVKYTL